MIEGYIFAAIVSGIGAVATLIVLRIRAGQKPNLAEGVIAFITAAAIVVGVKICVLSLIPDFFSEVHNERPFIFLGGLAVIWVSIDTLWILVFEKRQEDHGNPNR